MLFQKFFRPLKNPFFVIAIGLCFVSQGRCEDALPQKQTSIEGITEYRLENGVQVLLFPDASKPVVTVNMTIFVGSRHEGYGEAGMAHLLEHMLFKGTPLHPAVPKALQDRGARFNGTTWLDRTNYYETLPAQGDNLEFAIRLEADRLVNSFVKAEDLQSEMTVVRNEFEQGENSPPSVLQERIFSAAYQWHNYANSTIGNQSDIERVPIGRLQAFYRKFYRPDNVMLVVAGKFETDAALALIQKYFGVLESPKTPIDQTYTTEPPQDGERTTVVRRVGDTQLVAAGYHVPAGGDPEYPAVEVLAVVMGTEPSGRLYQSLVTKKLASSVFSQSYALHDPGIILFGAEVSKEASLEDARQSLLLAVEYLNELPVTDEEVERAKVELLKARELRATDTTSLATELSEWAAQGDWRLYFLNRDRLEKVKAADVQAVALKYLKQGNRTLGLFIPTTTPQRTQVPSRPDLAADLKGYKGRAEVTLGEEFEPTPANIDAKTINGKLANGVPYALLPKKTRGESVNLFLTLRFGDEKSLFGKVIACEMLGELMLHGTETMDYQQLKDKLDQLRANVSITVRPGLMQVSVRTLKPYVKDLMPVLKEILRSPKLDEQEFEILKDEQLTGLQSQVSEPEALAPLKVMRALSAYPRGDVRYVPTIEEEIEDLQKLKVSDVREIYEEFLNGQFGEFTAVGDVDPESLPKQISEMLDGWKSEMPYTRVPSPANTAATGQVLSINTPDKANALYYASQQYAIRDNHPQYAALVIGNFILGGGSLSSRLGDRVRQKEGLSYGVGSGVTGHPIDERTSFTIFAITNPDNRDKLVETIRQEIDRIRKDGVTEAELAAAKQGFLQSLQVSRTNDAGLAQTLLGNLFAQRTMKYQEEFEAQIQSLTVDQVNQAIRDFISPDRLIIATAGDFEKAASNDSSKKKE
jgi:zinc protease